ncbi:hypothetical protein [uncultured Sphingopyxis sp.]|uniref:hypothetical protein n=1 Tax=uncultured Sphingopyxis sp. TaxID=310581 RepID=UPI0025CF3A74|nr:hypothetical protein [uncultured Sphingopyxis sp.]
MAAFLAGQGQNLAIARSRRRNGEDIAFAWPPQPVVLAARLRGGEIEAISTSLRDLIDFVHGGVGKAWNIFIYLRPAFLP